MQPHELAAIIVKKPTKLTLATPSGETPSAALRREAQADYHATIAEGRKELDVARASAERDLARDLLDADKLRKDEAEATLAAQARDDAAHERGLSDRYDASCQLAELAPPGYTLFVERGTRRARIVGLKCALRLSFDTHMITGTGVVSIAAARVLLALVDPSTSASSTFGWHRHTHMLSDRLDFADDSGAKLRVDPSAATLTVYGAIPVAVARLATCEPRVTAVGDKL